MKFISLKKKFILGSVQFGQNYGITNKSRKKISFKEKIKIFRYCKKIGLYHFDSAEEYNFHFKPRDKNSWKIDTKITIGKKIDLEKIFLHKYKKFTLDTVYIRNPEKYTSKAALKLFEELRIFKKKKIIKKIGISVYDIKNLKDFIKKFDIDVVQLPYNIIDRRFEKIFSYLKSKKILIYARSLFLQGLLLSNNEIINHNSLKKFNKFAEGKDKLSLCLNFVKKNRYIDKYIIGIQNSSNLAQILNTKIIKNINFPKKLSSSDKKLIDPRLWVY